MIRVQALRSVDELPPAAIELLVMAAQEHIESSPGWFANLQDTVFRDDAGVRYYLAESDGAPVTVLPLRHLHLGPIHQIEALGHYYTSIYAPVIAGPQISTAVRMIFESAGRDLGSTHVIRIAPMDHASDAFAILQSALRAAGWFPFTFFCFGNWHQAVTGDWRTYLEARSGALRSNLRRKGKRFTALGGTLEVISDRALIELAIHDYNVVYAKSWKRPEPYPRFIPGLMSWLADGGMLRVGIARIDKQPVAAQIWVVNNGKASIFKLAHDKEFDGHGVGTLLTAHLMEHVIDRDRVTSVDYLIGDDAHKRQWMDQRRERWGIVAYNPRTLAGAGLLVREAVGRAIKRLNPMQFTSPPPTNAINWTVVPIQHFAQHRAHWDGLLASAGGTPFLESAFLIPALAEFSTGKEVLAFAERDGQWLASAILAASRPGIWQTFQPSQLPLGAWISGAEFVTQHALDSLVAALPGIALTVSLTQQDPLLNARPPDSARLRTLDYIQTAWVDIDQPFDAYWETRGKNLKTNCRKQRAKLEAEGICAAIECITDAELVASALRDYGELESQGWKGRDGTAVHPDNAQGKFYLGMLNNFCRMGRGRIYRYRFNEKVVAMDLCIESAERLVILKTAYDESHKTISPSTLMRQDEFGQLFADPALKQIEFYGKVMEWHKRWTANSRTLYHVTAYRWAVLARLHERLRGKSRTEDPIFEAE